ncbi:MAG: M24 family metallopeptidase [Verrucomicrobium sp.]|nr:M24 family metallopeptidase [Verrucomicrobium sp.]
MEEVVSFIRPGMREKDVAEKARALFLERGVASFWYHGIAARVLAGPRSLLSGSGRDYQPAEIPIGEEDFLTVDLTPEKEGVWGDYARSIFVREGRASLTADPAQEEAHAGAALEVFLHQRLRETARPGMTVDALCADMNGVIAARGFRNLDFKGNLGHSIERDLKGRRFLERGNALPLGELGLFTFEPHLCREGGAKGLKHEDMYYFSGDRLLAV